MTPGLKLVLDIELSGSHRSRALMEGMMSQAAQRPGRPWILFAPQVGRPLARALGEQGVNFADLAGNCRLAIGQKHFAQIEGKPPLARPVEGRGLGTAGYQVLFAALVRPELLAGSIRELAAAAGVATATAGDLVARLREEGLIDKDRGRRRLTDRPKLLERWLRGYEAPVRPRLLIGRYRTEDRTPQALEQRLEAELGDRSSWAFGGCAAGYRLAGFYRGPETVVHLLDPRRELPRKLRALRSGDGPLILLRAPGTLALEGVAPRTAAPLVIYAELLIAGDKRARDAAAEIHRRFLAEGR